MSEQKRLDAVFEGGGVKGIAFVGAVTVTEAKGYVFENVAGTSAGAIVASLIAAGYKASELKEIMNDLDYTRFKDKAGLDLVPLVGSGLSLLFEKGIYEGRYFEAWLRKLLAAKNIHTFSDLIINSEDKDSKYRYKLRVIASDISRGTLLKLPQDIASYGIDPDKLDVARAVRMSMSIPFFFEPVILQNAAGESSYIVDGGILSNFPVWLFDDDSKNPPWPTLGYRLLDHIVEGEPYAINGPISLLRALFSTMMKAHDARHIKEQDFNRTIAILTPGVSGTDFGLSRQKRDQLYQSGISAANKFFEEWNFEKYKKNRIAEISKE